MQNSLQLIIFAAIDIGVLVKHQARRMLAYALCHHASLVMVDCKAFFQRNCGHLNDKAADLPFESMIAGKQQIIGIAGVIRSQTPCQSGDSLVKPKSDQIGDDRRCRGTLREMGLLKQPTSSPSHRSGMSVRM